MVIKSLNNRIKEVRNALKLSQQDFAKLLGVSQGFISEVESGKKMPGSDFLLSLKRLNISYDWLLTGQGEMFRQENAALVPKERDIGDEFVMIPMVSGKISAGGGLIPETTVELKLAFRKDWIRRHGDPRNMSLIRVEGDSMEPTLYSGDIVLVDHNRNFISPQGGIYAIALDDVIMIKRLQVIYPEGKVRVISDNPKYETFEVHPDQLKINGKVIWFGREIEK